MSLRPKLLPRLILLISIIQILLIALLIFLAIKLNQNSASIFNLENLRLKKFKYKIITNSYFFIGLAILTAALGIFQSIFKNQRSKYQRKHRYSVENLKIEKTTLLIFSLANLLTFVSFLVLAFKILILQQSISFNFDFFCDVSNINSQNTANYDESLLDLASNFEFVKNQVSDKFMCR
jgi:hypothetical protein